MHGEKCEEPRLTKTAHTMPLSLSQSHTDRMSYWSTYNTRQSTFIFTYDVVFYCVFMLNESLEALVDNKGSISVLLNPNSCKPTSSYTENNQKFKKVTQ